METLEALCTRRSIKKYNDEPVSKADLEKLIAAGQNTPSGRNLQAYAFVVVENPALIAELSRLNADVFRQANPAYNGDPFYGAKAVIVVLADKDVRTYLYDGSLAMGNLLNAAHALGLGACWIHRAKEVFEMPAGQELLKEWGLENYEGIGFCILGHYDQPAPAAKERTSKVVWA